MQKRVGMLAGVMRRGVLVGILIAMLSAAPVLAHAGGATAIADSESVGDFDVSVWVDQDEPGFATVIVSLTERGRLVAGPAPVMSLLVDGEMVVEQLQVVAEDTGWWTADIAVAPGTEVVVGTTDESGRTTAAAFALDAGGPWWVHVAIVVGLVSVLALADKMIRQFVRSVRATGILEKGVGIRGNA